MHQLITSLLLALLPFTGSAQAENKHGKNTLFPTYEGLVMAGYQGWFRAEGDGSNQGWRHYDFGSKTANHQSTIDFWPDVSDYAKTYETGFTNPDGSVAKVFSSLDKSTTDLHFKWMKDYGVDGVFMQRFFGLTRVIKHKNKPADIILKNAIQAAKANKKAIAVMYDLSDLKAEGENCTSVMEDWKMLVDEMKVTNQGEGQTYLHHRGKPLVAIWGVGFPDRRYDSKKAEVYKLIDFLKNDPVYGGCSIMLGVPTYFRELSKDCLPDPHLHELIRSADIVLPWMVQRFTPLVHNHVDHIRDHIKADLKWTRENGVDYVPVVYPGFSWHNLAQREKGLPSYTPYGAIPRLGGMFYWNQIAASIGAGSKMIYVAMFDEIDEGTAIIKVANHPPSNDKIQFVSNDNVPDDHYLWLTGQAGKMLRKEIPHQYEMPTRKK